MTGALPRLSVGQNLYDVVTVRSWNHLIDTVERLKQLDKLVGELSRRSSGSSIVLVCNDTGDTLEQYSIVRLDGLKLTSGDDIKTEIPVECQPFSGKSADTNTSHWHKLAILQQPLAAGAVGPAKVSGVSYALVEITDSAHIRAYPNGTSCKSGAGPLRILYAPNPDDARPAIVLFDYGTQHYLGKAGSVIAAGTSGNVEIEGTDIQVPATNVSAFEVPADKLIGIQEESSKGTMYVNFEPCDGEEE